jgi:AcrR family transcriptional regulator
MGTADADDRSRGDLRAEVANLKRERIVEAATRLFATRGFHGTSVDAVAAALGVTKPFVYYHFKDKADILAAICRRGAELTLGAIKAAEVSRGTAAERLAQFCRSMAAIVIDHSHFLTVYNRETNALRDSDRRGILRIRTEIDRRVVALIEVGQTSGEFHVDDLAVTAVSINMMLSYLWIWYRENRTGSRSHVIETVTQLALRMAGAKSNNASELRIRSEGGDRGCA